jgi:hypothetical protein
LGRPAPPPPSSRSTESAAAAALLGAAACRCRADLPLPRRPAAARAAAVRAAAAARAAAGLASNVGAAAKRSGPTKVLRTCSRPAWPAIMARTSRAMAPTAAGSDGFAQTSVRKR